MRRSLWVLIIAVVLAIFFGLIGRASGISAFETIAGLSWITAIVAGVLALPFWHKVLPEVPSMPGLFPRPGPGQRWCSRCGSAADKEVACAICGHAPNVKEAKPKREKPRTKA